MRPFLFAALAILPFAAHAAPPATVVYFPEWSAVLDDPARGVIKEAAAIIKADKKPVRVIGYADKTGTPAANTLLSKLRAQVVTDALVADGAPADLLTQSDQGATPHLDTSLESRRVVIDFPG